MRVLHLVQSFGRGGRREAIATLIRGLARLGVASDLCLLNELGCPAHEVADLPAVVEVVGRRRRLDLAAAGHLECVCRKRGANVIHAHDGASQFIAALLRLRHPARKLLMTFHRSLGFESARLRDRLRNAAVGRLTAAVVTASRGRHSHYLSENFVPASKVIRIPIGIELGRFQPDEEARTRMRVELGVASEATVLGAVGHFGPEKGLDVILRALRELARRRVRDPLVLILVGDGRPADRESLRRLAVQTDARVIFTGFQHRVEQLLQVCDIFVHTPRQEAFGLVVAEAMATGLPVIASRVGGVTDMVRDGVNGTLVPPDSPKGVASALEILTDCPDLCRRMGATSRRIATTEYGADLYARRYQRLYADILANRPPRGVSHDVVAHEHTNPKLSSHYLDHQGASPCPNQ